jgi:hypothetical protein
MAAVLAALVHLGLFLLNEARGATRSNFLPAIISRRPIMRNFLIPVLVLSTSLLAAEEAKSYGKPLAVKEETLVSAILDSPDTFAGKTVRVKGLVTDVCESRGCWIQISGDRKGQKILFKVEDGVITFPMSAKGSQVVAEGIVSKKVLSVEQQKAACENEAKAHGKPVDYSKVTGPKTIIRLEGLGAEIK